MTAAPNATSDGDGGAAGALTAFTGISAAKAGAATETASAATTDKTTLFIEPAPFRSIDLQPIHFAHHSCAQNSLRDPGCHRPVRKRTCIRTKWRIVSWPGR